MFKALLLTLAITLAPRVATEPLIRKNVGSVYIIENPMKYDVVVTLNCGYDFQPVNLRVPSRTTEEYDIKTPDGRAATCLFDGWRKAKPGD